MTDKITLIYGKIRPVDLVHGEPRCLHVGEYPLAQQVRDFSGTRVTVRYWVSNLKLKSVDQATEQTLLQVMGYLRASIIHEWSEATGYLWTNDKLVVGGHDMLEELASHMGKFALLEITHHE